MTVAVVIGGATGIGRALACAVAQSGADVVIGDVNVAGMAQTRDLIEQAGGRIICRQADVADAASVAALVEAANLNFGGIDFLIYCAGIFPLSRVADMEQAEWDRVLAINLTGAFLCYKAVIPSMRARGGGRIIAIGTGRGTEGYDKGAHYSASKAGLIGLSKSLAIELWGDGITVNLLSPGITDTPQVRAQYSADELQAFIAQRGTRLGQPNDLDGLMLYLLSPEAAHVTGQVFTLRFP